MGYSRDVQNLSPKYKGISDHCVTAFPQLLKHGRWTLGSHGSTYDFAGKVTRARIFRSK